MKLHSCQYYVKKRFSHNSLPSTYQQVFGLSDFELTRKSLKRVQGCAFKINRWFNNCLAFGLYRFWVWLFSLTRDIPHLHEMSNIALQNLEIQVRKNLAVEGVHSLGSWTKLSLDEYWHVVVSRWLTRLPLFLETKCLPVLHSNYVEVLMMNEGLL